MRRFLVAVALSLVTGMAAAGPVNINTADAKLLAKELKGVGPKKAEAIVKYRTEHGGFKTAEEIEKVKGVDKKIFDANKENIKIKD